MYKKVLKKIYLSKAFEENLPWVVSSLKAFYHLQTLSHHASVLNFSKEYNLFLTQWPSKRPGRLFQLPYRPGRLF